MDVNDNLLQLQGIGFAYHMDIPVLDGLDLDLRQGEKLALLGHNGSGKTTLLHIIVGLLKPHSGSIFLDGKESRTEADFREVRSRVGLLFQDADDQLFSPTVAEDVAFGPLNLGKSREEARAIVREILEAVGMSGFEERIIYRLSSGEKKLISLASVLAMRPDILLLDEPTGGLDEDARERTIRIINNLPQAMIIVSHDRDFLKKTCSKAVLLAGGRLEPFRLSP